jgi:subtilisin family serine protease
VLLRLPSRIHLAEVLFNLRQFTTHMTWTASRALLPVSLLPRFRLFKATTGFVTPRCANDCLTFTQVAYIEPDGIATINTAVDQAGATWGLGRISHSQSGAADYYYDDSAGAGSCAYIIDTGVFADHPEFGGRAKLIKSYTGVNTDDNGHGTHVSGTIGSATYGVAKNALLFGIKVLDAQGSGAWTDIVSGIQYAVKDSAARAASCPNGFVVNMSLGGGKTESVNSAVAAAVDAGLFFAVAAGNDGVDYSNTSPASEPKAFAVGASDNADSLAYFSNFGENLGVIAPGVDILSTWKDGSTKLDSGTSMATP